MFVHQSASSSANFTFSDGKTSESDQKHASAETQKTANVATATLGSGGTAAAGCSDNWFESIQKMVATFPERESLLLPKSEVAKRLLPELAEVVDQYVSQNESIVDHMLTLVQRTPATIETSRQYILYGSIVYPSLRNPTPHPSTIVFPEPCTSFAIAQPIPFNGVETQNKEEVEIEHELCTWESRQVAANPVFAADAFAEARAKLSDELDRAAARNLRSFAIRNVVGVHRMAATAPEILRRFDLNRLMNYLEATFPSFGPHNTYWHHHLLQIFPGKTFSFIVSHYLQRLFYKDKVKKSDMPELQALHMVKLKYALGHLELFSERLPAFRDDLEQYLQYIEDRLEHKSSLVSKWHSNPELSPADWVMEHISTSSTSPSAGSAGSAAAPPPVAASAPVAPAVAKSIHKAFLRRR